MSSLPQHPPAAPPGMYTQPAPPAVVAAPPYPYPPVTPLPEAGRWNDPTRPPGWQPTPVPGSPQGAPTPSSNARRVGLSIVSGVLLAVVALFAGFVGGAYAALSIDAGNVAEPPARSQSTFDAVNIVAGASPSVVAVQTATSAGTGFVVARPDGQLFVLTNAHVVAGTMETVTIRTGTGDEHVGTVLGRDPAVDLAVLRVEGLDAAPLTLRPTIPQVGEQVVAIGNALDIGVSPSVTSGIVSAVERTITAPDGTELTGLIQTDTAINPGNSGGPLLDASGRVVGVTTAKIDQSVAQGVGFAIPVATVEAVLEALSRGTRLGVSVETTDQGTRVVAVSPSSAAAEAGVLEGDVIEAFDGVAVESSEALVTAVAQRAPGDRVTITLRRGAEAVELQVTLKGA